jgi:hypothetical protein
MMEGLRREAGAGGCRRARPAHQAPAHACGPHGLMVPTVVAVAPNRAVEGTRVTFPLARRWQCLMMNWGLVARLVVRWWWWWRGPDVVWPCGSRAHGWLWRGRWWVAQAGAPRAPLCPNAIAYRALQIRCMAMGGRGWRLRGAGNVPGIGQAHITDITINQDNRSPRTQPDRLKTLTPTRTSTHCISHETLEGSVSHKGLFISQGPPGAARGHPRAALRPGSARRGSTPDPLLAVPRRHTHTTRWGHIGGRQVQEEGQPKGKTQGSAGKDRASSEDSSEEAQIDRREKSKTGRGGGGKQVV